MRGFAETGACLLLLASQTQAATPPIFGTLDPRTNVFTQQLVTRPPASTPPEIVRSGVLNVSVIVAVPASLPAGTSYFVSISASTSDDTYQTYVSASAAAAVSGKTARATVKLPYVFTVSSTSDIVTVSLELFTSNGETIQSTQMIPLPAEGASTPLTIRQTS